MKMLKEEILAVQRNRNGMVNKYPFYFKCTVILLGLVLLVYALGNLKDILVPLCFSMLLAILLNPITTRLQQRKIPRVWAIILSLMVALIIIGGIGYFLFSQISSFSIELPAFRHKITTLLTRLQQFVDSRLGISVKKQDLMLGEAETSMKPVIGSTIGSLSSYMTTIMLLPVYTFLFLYYKTLLLDFIYEICHEENSMHVGTILRETKKAVQNYMVGLLLESLIVAIMNSTALTLLGIDYAILLGVMGAVLNILPFIGGILAAALPLLVATATREGFQVHIWIIVSYMCIQFIDNHFLVPYIVSSRVKINALISIVIVLLGGALWGVPGMFLAIPFIGVLKIIFDRIPELRPWGRLLGVEVPRRHKGQIWNPLTKKVHVHHRKTQ